MRSFSSPFKKYWNRRKRGRKRPTFRGDEKKRYHLINPVGKEETVVVDCTDDPNSLGAQDYIFPTIKSPALLPSLKNIKPLIGENTTIITCMNGIPHWYFHRFEQSVR